AWILSSQRWLGRQARYSEEISFFASSFCAEEPSFATSFRMSRAPSLSPISRYALASSSFVPAASSPPPAGESRLRSVRFRSVLPDEAGSAAAADDGLE